MASSKHGNRRIGIIGSGIGGRSVTGVPTAIVPRALRKRRRPGAGPDQPIQAEPEEPGRAGGGGRGGGDGPRKWQFPAAFSRSTPH
jgi:hypothetical protein